MAFSYDVLVLPRVWLLLRQNFPFVFCPTIKNTYLCSKYCKCFIQKVFLKHYGKFQGFRSREHSRDVC